jgi:hypothetical protein
MHVRNLKFATGAAKIILPATSTAISGPKAADMRFLRRLLTRFCSHRFTWPRLDGNGSHYQICLLCGTAYEYDWQSMRRTNQLPTPEAQHQ